MLPAFPTLAPKQLSAKVASIVSNRVQKAEADLRRRAFGHQNLHYGLWLFENCALLALDRNPVLREAENRRLKFGWPYPGLLHVGSSSGAIGIDDSTNVLIESCAFGGMHPESAAIAIRGNSSATLINIDVEFDIQRSGLHKIHAQTLFVVSFGSFISRENCVEYLDDLLASRLSKVRAANLIEHSAAKLLS